MSLEMSRNRIFKEFEVLRLRWEQTLLTWQDQVRQEFAADQWNQLDLAVLTTLGAMDRLAPVMNQVRQDCGSREMI